MKLLYTSLFLLLTILSYGQKSTLFQNINFRAKELKHNLNKAGDSLILEGERTIFKVTIFNGGFEKIISVKDSKAKIPLNDIPVGRFVVEATLQDKLIVLTLLRNEYLTPTEPISVERKKTSLFETAPRLVVLDKKESLGHNKEAGVNGEKAGISATKVAIVDETSATINKNKTIDERSTVANTLATNPARKEVKTYWIVYKTNKTAGAGTVKRFGDQAIVDRLISHINLDKRTIAGRQNELTVWEIYDVGKFVKYKMKKSNDLRSEAECYNSKPYFMVKNNTIAP
jgi:hypothetical protein